MRCSVVVRSLSADSTAGGRCSLVGSVGWKNYSSSIRQLATTTNSSSAQIRARPFAYPLPSKESGKGVALVVIDMQRDFLLEGGFGAVLGMED